MDADLYPLLNGHCDAVLLQARCSNVLFRKYFQVLSFKRFRVIDNLLKITDQFIGKLYGRSVFALSPCIILILDSNDNVLAISMEAAVFLC